MSKKTKTKNEPWAPAQPFILQGLENSGRVFEQQQPSLEKFSEMQMDTYGRLAPGAEQGILAAQSGANAWASGSRSGQNPGNATYAKMQAANDPSMGLLSGMTGQRQTGDYSGFGGANPALGRASELGDGGFVGQGDSADYWRKSLDGGFLNGNPHLDSVIDSTRRGVSDQVGRRFGASGVGFGKSTAHADVLSRNLAEAEGALRYQDYGTERGYQNQAAGLLDGATRADRGQQLQALGMAGDMHNQSEAMRLGATQAGDQARNAEFAQRMQATGLLGDNWARQMGLQMQGAQGADAAYNADMAREFGAYGMAQDLMRGSQGLLGEAANLPWLGVGALNGNVRQASNGYGTTTSTQSGLGNYMDVYSNYLNAVKPSPGGG